MYAMVDFGGNQYKVAPGEKILVLNLHQDAGAIIENTNVMLVSDDNNIVSVGKPYLSSAKVTLEVVKNFKGDKVIVFKKKRRKGYKVKRGFRPQYTQLKVLSITK